MDAERAVEEHANQLLGDLGVAVDVTNEARVHLWYAERFGRSIPPYGSVEQAIATWPTTASSVGITDGPAGFAVCAPFGLSDLFAMVVRPNKAIVSEAVYQAKADRWARAVAEAHRAAVVIRRRRVSSLIEAVGQTSPCKSHQTDVAPGVRPVPDVTSFRRGSVHQLSTENRRRSSIESA